MRELVQFCRHLLVEVIAVYEEMVNWFFPFNGMVVSLDESPIGLSHICDRHVRSEHSFFTLP
jgi:hypothetical protein